MCSVEYSGSDHNRLLQRYQLIHRHISGSKHWTKHTAVPKIWGITDHLGNDKIHLCMVIKIRLGGDKTGFYSLQFEETDIVTLRLN